jgi:lipopolysaccharide biosynthesis glycosyltransferase
MVLIDADIIVTRPLTELLDAALANRVVGFENDRQRFVAEWGELLDLGTARPRPYVSSGLFVLGGAVGAEVLGLMDDRQRRVDMDRTLFGRNDPGYAFLYPEQDVLNAILATRVEPARVQTLPNRLAPNPPFEGLRLVDRDALRCAYHDEEEPFVLHHFQRKPWLVPMYHGIYSRLLARALLGDGLEVRVPPDWVPLRFRDGLLARTERARVNIVDVFRRYVLERTG